MEPNIYEDPGEFSSKPPPPFPSGPTIPAPPTITTTTQLNTVTVGQGPHGDPNAASEPFSCHFEDTFTEASEPKVPDIIRNCYKVAYSKVLLVSYVLLSVIIGPIFVVIFGMVLGMTSFTITWVMSPIFRLTGMCFFILERFITGYLNCCLAPYCRVVGNVCSRLVVRYQKVPSGEVIYV